MKDVFETLWRIKEAARKSDFLRVLSSMYWTQIIDIPLNNKFRKFQPPTPIETPINDTWEVVQFPDCQIHWPREYSSHGLRWVYSETFAPYKMNPHSYETFKVKIIPGDWVVDAGACEGFFVHYALSRKAKVLAIEPVPLLAEALTQTFSEEIKSGKVVVLNAGLGNSNHNSRIHITPNDVFCSSIQQDDGYQIPIYTLDEILNQGIIPKMDFLKMDIEGEEKNAIVGANNALKSRPKLSLAVYHSYNNANLIKKIIQDQQIGYKVSFRGAYLDKSMNLPRPYMLHAY